MVLFEGQRRLILIGPQGSGKGTQGELLSVYLQIPTISTGALCRKEIEEHTTIGRGIEEYVHSGHLVPDAIVADLLRARLKDYDASEGYIIDGFPRTFEQASESFDWLRPTHAIVIELDDEHAIARAGSRRACVQCRYKTTAQYVAQHGDQCPRCYGKLIMREDDNPEIIRARLAAYRAQSEPVISFFEERKIVSKFDGSKTIPEVFMEIARVL